jgi:hypothetical protein
VNWAGGPHWKILIVLSLALYWLQNLPQQRTFVIEWLGFVGKSQKFAPTGGGASEGAMMAAETQPSRALGSRTIDL